VKLTGTLLPGSSNRINITPTGLELQPAWPRFDPRCAY